MGDVSVGGILKSKAILSCLEVLLFLINRSINGVCLSVKQSEIFFSVHTVIT